MLRPVASSSDVLSFRVPERLDLFPTPVTFWRWDHADEYVGPIMSAVIREHGRVLWGNHNLASAPDPTRWPDPGVVALVRWVAACAQAASLGWRDGIGLAEFGPWRVAGRSNVTPPNSFAVSRHYARRNWHWTAIYSVAEACTLTFEERGFGLDLLGTATRRSRRVTLQPGQLAVFPAWLSHRIEPHTSNGDRVDLRFNLYNPALERSRLWEDRPSWAWRIAPKLLARASRLFGWKDRSADAPPGADIVP